MPRTKADARLSRQRRELSTQRAAPAASALRAASRRVARLVGGLLAPPPRTPCGSSARRASSSRSAASRGRVRTVGGVLAQRSARSAPRGAALELGAPRAASRAARSRGASLGLVGSAPRPRARCARRRGGAGGSAPSRRRPRRRARRAAARRARDRPSPPASSARTRSSIGPDSGLPPGRLRRDAAPTSAWSPRGAPPSPRAAPGPARREASRSASATSTHAAITSGRSRASALSAQAGAVGFGQLRELGRALLVARVAQLLGEPLALRDEVLERDGVEVPDGVHGRCILARRGYGRGA